MWNSRNLPKAPSCDLCQESNPKPSDLGSSTLPTGPEIQIVLITFVTIHVSRFRGME